MLPLSELLVAPETLTFTRNNKSIVAQRVELTSTPLRISQVTIGDSAVVDCFSAIRLRADEYRCFVYEWAHRQRIINVCLVVAPNRPHVSRIVELPIRQTFAPHVPGIPVDSAEVSLGAGDKTFTVTSGLGDGYYPVYAAKPRLRLPTALVLDFKIWEVRTNLILRGNQRLDEFGMIYEDEG